jgi:hypothetical protein
MPLRLRKFVGAIMLIALVVTWALLAMALAQSAVVKTNGLIEVIYYIVAGLAGCCRRCRLFAGCRGPTPFRHA